MTPLMQADHQSLTRGSDRRSRPDVGAAVTVKPAGESDAREIAAVLRANRADRTLLRRSEKDIGRHLTDFLVARGGTGRVVGCAALHDHGDGLGETLSLAVDPACQRLGIGSRLVRECISRAPGRGLPRLWLATAKADFFARFGFAPISMWSLPTWVLLAKLKMVLTQRPTYWLPAVFTRYTFMMRETGRPRSTLPSDQTQPDPLSVVRP